VSEGKKLTCHSWDRDGLTADFPAIEQPRRP
jgi:hypothetical protein